MFFFFFFFNDTATTEIYTLSLHDALPISLRPGLDCLPGGTCKGYTTDGKPAERQAAVMIHEEDASPARSEEHTSELQSQSNLVCRLLLEKKKQTSEARHDLCGHAHVQLLT